MRDYFNLSLKKMWLLVSLFSLGLPMFIPSSASWQDFFENVIGTVMVTMFILSFPCSVLGLPFLLFANVLLEINPASIEGLYFNLFFLFILGMVQWFWIAPRLTGNSSLVQTLNLPGAKAEKQFPETSAMGVAQSFNFQALSPIERVFQEHDSE